MSGDHQGRATDTATLLLKPWRILGTHSGCYRDLVRIQGLTIEVGDLTAARNFYEKILGFQPGDYYSPTGWLPYEFDGQYFAIREVDGTKPRDDFDITNFEMDEVADVERLWDTVRDVADVAEPLATTPYGTYKFVVRDPDGYRLGFVAPPASEAAVTERAERAGRPAMAPAVPPVRRGRPAAGRHHAGAPRHQPGACPRHVVGFQGRGPGR